MSSSQRGSVERALLVRRLAGARSLRAEGVGDAVRSHRDAGAAIRRPPPGARRILLSFIASLAFTGAYAQDADTVTTREVELISVDFVEQIVEDGRVIRRLRNARLRQETTYLEADRVREDEAANQYRFEGNVLIADEGDTLTALRVDYNSASKTGHARGDVRLSDGEVQVFAPSGFYEVNEKHAIFTEGVRLVDSTATITSREAEYWTDDKRGTFVGDVKLREIGTFMASDTLNVFRETEESLAWGNVFIRRYGSRDADEEPAATEADTLVVTYLLGQEAYNDERRNFSRVTGEPIVMQIRHDTSDANVDTTVVRAGTIEVARSDSLDRLTATVKVRIWQHDFSAVGDSVVYDRIPIGEDEHSETIELLLNPTAWFEDAQVHGDTIRVHARSGSLDTLIVEGRAFLAQMDTTLERVHQLSGRSMRGRFEDDTLRTLFVGPNARVIRFLANEDDQLSGAVQASSDRITFYFERGELARAVPERDVEGTEYPVAQIPTPFELDGFRWNPELRPHLADLVDVERIRRAIEQADQETQPAPEEGHIPILNAHSETDPGTATDDSRAPDAEDDPQSNIFLSDPRSTNAEIDRPTYNAEGDSQTTDSN